MNRAPHLIIPALLASISTVAYAEQSKETATIEQITIEASPTANTLPVGTFDSPISNLEYDRVLTCNHAIWLKHKLM